MRPIKMLSILTYLVSWTVCITPATIDSQYQTWDDSETKTEQELKQINDALAVIEKDEMDLSEEEKSFINHYECECSSHLSFDSLKDEIDPSAYDSGDRTEKEVERIEHKNSR